MDEVKESNIEIVKIDESEVPALIHEQFTILSEYTSNLEIARKKADEVNQQAVKSKEKGVHFFKMKDSIEDLQANQVALSESNRINMELQEKSLEYQKKLSEIMQYLLGLGVANITMNRCVVKELMMRLNDASEDEIDDMTRKEILKVVQQLKAQEDLYIKTMEITGKVKEHDSKIISQESKDIEHDNYIKTLLEENKELKQKVISLENKHNKRFIVVATILAACLIVGVVALVISIIK